MSIMGKKRNQNKMEIDKRNYLILYVISFIKEKLSMYFLIENVPTLLKIKLLYKNQFMTVIDILQMEFGELYEIDGKVLDSSDFSIPQTNLRAIIKMNKKGKRLKKHDKKVTVWKDISYLPTLESGETSEIKCYFARKYAMDNILWMKHTPAGKSVFSNKIFYSPKKDGIRIKEYESSYRKINWHTSAPTIIIRNDCIASQRNVHHGRLLSDGAYSDARVFILLELMILNSLPTNWKIPDYTPELLIRQYIGESIPPPLH